MANRYFGALGDVWKHLPLAELFLLNPPLHYWETHAGSAAYPLTESPARLCGVFRFLARAAGDRDLAACSYLKALQSTPGLYPGSPLLAMRALGQRANYLFCDTDPESVRTLQEAGAHLPVRIVADDGVAAVRGEVESGRFNPADVLVHVDPYDPYERLTPDAATPVELAAFLATHGYRLFYWYGFDSVTERAWARDEISRLAPAADLWCGAVTMPASFVYPGQSGAWGCGVVLANMTAAEAAMCARLGTALERIAGDDLLAGSEPAGFEFSVVQ